jgi:hypothetical protein
MDTPSSLVGFQVRVCGQPGALSEASRDQAQSLNGNAADAMASWRRPREAG